MFTCCYLLFWNYIVLCPLPPLFIFIRLFWDIIKVWCLYSGVCHWIFVMLFNMSASGSALAFCCFVEWCCMYASAITVVGLMWHLLHVMHLPLVMHCIMYDLSWWLWLPMPTTVPWVHGLPSSCWTTTADSMGIHGNIAEASLVLFYCLSTSLLWWSSSQSLTRGLQSITGMMPQTCLLNINVAGLSKPWINGII